MKINAFGSVPESTVAAFEAKYHICFPREYKDFLCRCNGGLVVRDGSERIKVDALNDTIEAEVLYGFGLNENCFDIEYWMEQFGDELPQGSVLIGNDMLKGFLVMMIQSEEVKIVYWDDERNFAASSDASNAYLLFDSFATFWKTIGGIKTDLKVGEKMIENKMIPLGSIVILQGGVQKLLVISRALNVRNGDKTFFFDYGAVPYPEGLVSDKMVYFNADQINIVVFEGYRDAEDQAMVDMIGRYLEQNPDIVRGDPKNWA